MGLSGRALLWRVELPLAMPVIMAGVRVATVTTIGLVTVTALIGQGGLGQQILLGFQLDFPTRIYVGAALSIGARDPRRRGAPGAPAGADAVGQGAGSLRWTSARLVAWFADPANWTGTGGRPQPPLRARPHLGGGRAGGHGDRPAARPRHRPHPAGRDPGGRRRERRSGAAVARGAHRAHPDPRAWAPAPTLVALALLGIPPIVTNAYVGVREVEDDVVEAGRAMGMPGRSLLRRVELPVALPVILAGIRLSAVQIVATATLWALVAGGGLGRYIIDGFAVRDYPRIVAGAILVALLAIATEVLFEAVEPAARVARRPTAHPVAARCEPDIWTVSSRAEA